jgi:Kef-type K+ transport system membrane component KefB
LPESWSLSWAAHADAGATLVTFEWALWIALAALAGHVIQRITRLPKIIGYAVVGMVAGWLQLPGARWPLTGVGLFLLELGIAVVVFEAGARLPLRWFRHNPLVLVQSAAEALLTYAAAFLLLHALGIEINAARALAAIAVAASPSVLLRIVAELRAGGPVTDRAVVLTTLNTLYALTLGTALLHTVDRGGGALLASVGYSFAVLGVSALAGFVLAALLALAMRVLQPTSPDTAIVILAAVAACTTVADPLGGSGPLAALVGGVLLKQFHRRPWVWPRQLGTAASTLVILMFVLVSVVAVQGPWTWRAVGVALALLLARAIVKVGSLTLTSFGTGMSVRQTLWVGAALVPMSSVALLLTSQFVATSHTVGAEVATIALPMILLAELLGAISATAALQRSNEITLPWRRVERAEEGSEGSP